MNNDLIEIPRFNFFIGDEVLLKGKIVGFDVDENKCIENVVRLEYGQTLKVPNSTIYITDNIVDKSKIKVTIPQFVAEFITEQKKLGHTLSYSIDASMSDIVAEWYWDNSELFARAWLDGYEVEKEKLVKVRLKGTGQYLCNDETGLHFQHGFKTDFTKDYLEKLDFGWVFSCPGIEIEEVE